MNKNHLDGDTISAVWPDRAVMVSGAAGAVGASLPTDPNGVPVDRVMVTASAGQEFSFTLSQGANAMTSFNEGIAWFRGTAPIILSTRGVNFINTYAKGAVQIHVVPLAD